MRTIIQFILFLGLASAPSLAKTTTRRPKAAPLCHASLKPFARPPANKKAFFPYERVVSEGHESDFDILGNEIKHLPTGLVLGVYVDDFVISIEGMPIEEFTVGQLDDYPKEDFGKAYADQNTFYFLQRHFARRGLRIDTADNGKTVVLESPLLRMTVTPDLARSIRFSGERENVGRLLLAAIELKADFTEFTDEDLGVVWPEQREESGFVIGGKNSNAAIRRLREKGARLNGMLVAEIERNMVPGECVPKDVRQLNQAKRGKSVFADSSDCGFLAWRDQAKGVLESLTDVLAAQNDLVLKGMAMRSHQDLMRAYYRLLFAFRNGFLANDREFFMGGHRYTGRVVGVGAGHLYSPFGDRTRTRSKFTLSRLSGRGRDRSQSVSTLVVEMAYRYGFYESPSIGTSHHLDPRMVLDVMPFLRPR